MSGDSFCSAVSLSTLDWGRGAGRISTSARGGQVLLNYVRQPLKNCRSVVPDGPGQRSVGCRNRLPAQSKFHVKAMFTNCFRSRRKAKRGASFQESKTPPRGEVHDSRAHFFLLVPPSGGHSSHHHDSPGGAFGCPHPAADLQNQATFAICWQARRTSSTR